MPISIDGSGSISGISTFSFSDEIIHTGDTNTAIKFPANDTITFETGGSERLRLDSNGIRTPDDIFINVRGKGFKTSDWIITNTTSGNALSISGGASSGEKLRIDGGGRLLVGTTTGGLTDYGDSLTIADANAGMTLRVAATNQASHIYFADGTSGDAQYRGYVQYHHNNDEMKFGTAATERLRITSTGNVRLLDYSTAVDSGADDFVVGTTNSGINRGITILSHTGADARICFATASDPDEGMIKYSHGSDVMQFFVNAAERMRIQNLGDAEYGMKFFDNKAIEFKSNQSGIFSNTWYINPNTWTNFFSIPSYFQGWVFLNSTHNAGNSSALWSVSKSSSGGAHCNRFAHDNLYGPATVSLRINGVWVQLNSSYTTYGYAIINATAGGNGVANLSG